MDGLRLLSAQGPLRAFTTGNGLALAPQLNAYGQYTYADSDTRLSLGFPGTVATATPFSLASRCGGEGFLAWCA
jgi:hypothetical protein